HRLPPLCPVPATISLGSSPRATLKIWPSDSARSRLPARSKARLPTRRHLPPAATRLSVGTAPVSIYAPHSFRLTPQHQLPPRAPDRAAWLSGTLLSVGKAGTAAKSRPRPMSRHLGRVASRQSLQPAPLAQPSLGHAQFRKEITKTPIPDPCPSSSLACRSFQQRPHNSETRSPA